MKKTPSELIASRKYNLKNKDLINKKSLLASKKNPEKKRENQRRYRERNRDKINARARERNLKLKNEKEEKNKMFGTRKTAKKVEAKPEAVPTTPDLIVQKPNTVGMPGFTEDPVAPAPAPVAEAPAPISNPLAVPVAEPTPVVAPAPAPVAPAPVAEAPAPVKDQYQIVSAEMIPEGMYRYVIVTNKVLGDVGGVYDI